MRLVGVVAWQKLNNWEAELRGNTETVEVDENEDESGGNEWNESGGGHGDRLLSSSSVGLDVVVPPLAVAVCRIERVRRAKTRGRGLDLKRIRVDFALEVEGVVVCLGVEPVFVERAHGDVAVGVGNFEVRLLERHHLDFGGVRNPSPRSVLKGRAHGDE